MPLGDLAEGLFHILGRMILQFFTEIVFEILIKGAGYLILMPFYRLKELDPEGFAVIITGILFWLVVLGSGVFIYRQFLHS